MFYLTIQLAVSVVLKQLKAYNMVILLCQKQAHIIRTIKNTLPNHTTCKCKIKKIKKITYDMAILLCKTNNNMVRRLL